MQLRVQVSIDAFIFDRWIASFSWVQVIDKRIRHDTKYRITNEVSDWIKDTTMTIAKSNRYKDYMKEIEHIEYEYLDRNVRLDPLQ